DPQGAQVVAVDVGTAPKDAIGPNFKLEGADTKIAALLGTKADDIAIKDVVVEPGTNIAYVSVMRGKGPTAEPAIVRVDGKGNLTTLPLDKVAYSKISISNAPADSPAAKGKASARQQSITDLGSVDGKQYLLLSNSARGVMKISTESIDKQQALTEPVRDGGKAGLPYETIASLDGTTQLDKVGNANVLVLAKGNIEVVPLP